MKHQLLAAIYMTTMVGLGAAVSAQSGATAKDQTAKQAAMKDAQMTASGCVAAGKAEGQFMLTHATMTGGMMKMDKDKMKPGMTTEHTMTFELVGGTNVKAHMGHKVEVTGTMDKMDRDHMAQMEKMDKTAKDKMMADMKPMKLNVTAVKMISATCP